MPSLKDVYDKTIKKPIDFTAYGSAIAADPICKEGSDFDPAATPHTFACFLDASGDASLVTVHSLKINLCTALFLPKFMEMFRPLNKYALDFEAQDIVIEKTSGQISEFKTQLAAENIGRLHGQPGEPIERLAELPDKLLAKFEIFKQTLLDARVQHFRNRMGEAQGLRASENLDKLFSMMKADELDMKAIRSFVDKTEVLSEEAAGGLLAEIYWELEEIYDACDCVAKVMSKVVVRDSKLEDLRDDFTLLTLYQALTCIVQEGQTREDLLKKFFAD